MKKFILIICTFWCILFNAQLDTEHWFAPMSAKAGTNGLEGYLYLSTDETTSFPVQIFNNNTLFTTVQVSKNNPAQVIIPNQFLIASSQNQLFTQNNMGLNVKGTKKFFANYRFSMPNHAEILTSKGAAGLGTIFYAGVAPISGSENHMNATIGVTATEDNTVVTISGYNPAITFSDGISSPTRTFTINKGKSYILDVVSSWSYANRAGLVGAKITATKPITVTNGNFNAAYTSLNLTNNDILMDQAVPVDRLGKDFVLVKGNGTVTSQMETALIIATENNTQVTFNANTATTVTLNEGQYYLVPSARYQNQGAGHYNMNITSSKNIYVYQLLSGATNGNEYASGGMNFIPPLSCFMPNKIEEIGFINRIGGQTFATRLNIITQTGANVTINNNPIAAANGPYPVTGNPNWVSYSIQNVTGNITVNSTKAMTAGIAAGSGAVGYGGYFAGFSSVPAITKTGDCYTGVQLQVDNNYDAYQWYFNGVAITGANTYFINPELYGAGEYTCSVTKNNCETRLTTIYNYTLCPPISTTTYTIGSCNTKIIAPVFTNSTQSIVPSLTSIIVQPTSGTATVNPTTGQITYTPNPTTVNTTDQFTYYIQGNGNPFDFEYFKVIINTDVLVVNNTSLSSCNNASGNGTYDLTSATVTNAAGSTITYYTDVALTNQITNPISYSAPAGVVYANVTSSYGCSQAAQITLIVNPAPNINTTNFNAALCDDNFDGMVNVNFDNVTAQIVTNTAGLTIRYYLNQADANAGNNNTLPINWTYTANTIVYVRVDGPSTICPSAFGQINFTIGPKITLLTTNFSTDVCDNDLNNSENVNLNDYKNQFTTDPSVTITFHTSLANAQAGTNSINANQVINSPVTFYVRFTSYTGCPNTGILNVKLKSPKKSDYLTDRVICSGDRITLNAGEGFTSYLWSNGATTSSITAGIGTYFVDLGFNGCIYRQTIEVKAAEAPTITSIIVSSTSATINVTGGTPPYQYSLDGIEYQASNVFTGLSRGPHKVYVIGKDGCEPIVKDFIILNLINAITPNGDGINDVLDYSDLKIKDQVQIEVVDRYGAVVYKSSPNTYKWDGKLGGRNLPTGTYWYILRWIEPDTKLPISHSGWILIKNRN